MKNVLSYISETWERYRNRYEHLGDKNPFADDPPSPEFLLSKYGPPGYRPPTEGKTLETPNKDENTIVENESVEDIAPPVEVDSNATIISDEKEFKANILEDVEIIEPLEPEESESQSESNLESDQNLNNIDTFAPIEDESTLSDESKTADEPVIDIEEDKPSAVAFTEENVITQPSEYDEVNAFKKANKPPSPDVKTSSPKEKNNPPRKIFQKNSEQQKQDQMNKIARKSNKNNQKQYQKTQEQLRPLVNPYFTPPYGSPMMSMPNPLYPFQPPNPPFNYWLPKPPMSQFNMFPYGYPWQGYPFPTSYFPPFYQHNFPPAPYMGTPTTVGQPSLGPPYPTPMIQPQMNVPNEVAGPAYTTVSPNQTLDRPFRQYHPNNQRTEVNQAYHGQQTQLNQNVNNRRIPKYDMNTSNNYRREQSQVVDPTEVKQTSLPSSYNSRLPQPTSFKTQVSPPPHPQHSPPPPPPPPPPPTANQWTRDLGQNHFRFPTTSQPFHTPSPTHHPQQRMNYPTQQYGATIEYDRTRVRPNTEYQHHNNEPPTPPMSYNSWFTDPSTSQ